MRSSTTTIHRTGCAPKAILQLGANIERNISFQDHGSPKMMIAKTVKGKSVPMFEGQGPWHNRMPHEGECQVIMEALSCVLSPSGSNLPTRCLTLGEKTPT